MKYSLLICFSFNCLYSFPQTCVIAKKTKDAIYIGSDSRVSGSRIVNGKEIIDTGSIKKIYWCGNVGYAVIGSFGTYAINKLITNCKKDASSKSIELSYQSFFYWLADTLSVLKTTNKRQFDTYIKKWGKATSQLIIFGKESDSLFMFRIKIYFNQAEQNLKYEPSVRTDLLYAGEVDEIKDTLETKSVWGNGIVKTIKNLIDISSHYHPMEVGGKTDILKVTLKGIMWIKEP